VLRNQFARDVIAELHAHARNDAIGREIRGDGVPRWPTRVASRPFGGTVPVRNTSRPGASKIDYVTAGGLFEVIEFMEQRPALVAELLRVHVDDGTGHCAGCSWRQAAVPIHPCGIRWYAERADETLRNWLTTR
jgi:hypothetical protein